MSRCHVEENFCMTRRKVMKVRIRKKRSSKLALLLCRSLPLFKDHRRVRGGGLRYAKHGLHNQSSLQNEVSAREAHWCMNAENEKRQQTDEAKGETGAMWAAVHLRQGVGAAALSLTLSPPHPTRSLSFFIYFPLSISFLHWKGHSLTRNTGHRTLK